MRQLTKAGCKKVLREVAGGAKNDRTRLCRVLNQIEVGDVLMVMWRDRFAGPPATCRTRWPRSPNPRKTPDPSATHGRLMLTVLGGLAEFHRELIRAKAASARRRRGRVSAYRSR